MCHGGTIPAYKILFLLDQKITTLFSIHQKSKTTPGNLSRDWTTNCSLIARTLTSASVATYDTTPHSFFFIPFIISFSILLNFFFASFFPYSFLYFSFYYRFYPSYAIFLPSLEESTNEFRFYHLVNFCCYLLLRFLLSFSFIKSYFINSPCFQLIGSVTTRGG